jgi:hypothetical protein
MMNKPNKELAWYRQQAEPKVHSGFLLDVDINNKDGGNILL